MDGGRIVCLGLQAEPVALVKRAHGRAAHNSRSSFGAQGAYLVSATPAVVAVGLSLQSCTFQIQQKKADTLRGKRLEVCAGRLGGRDREELS